MNAKFAVFFAAMMVVVFTAAPAHSVSFENNSGGEVVFPEPETSLQFEPRPMLALPQAPAPSVPAPSTAALQRPALSIPPQPAASAPAPRTSTPEVAQPAPVAPAASSTAPSPNQNPRPAGTGETLSELLTSAAPRPEGLNSADLIVPPPASGRGAEAELLSRMAEPEGFSAAAPLRESLGEPLNLFSERDGSSSLPRQSVARPSSASLDSLNGIKTFAMVGALVLFAGGVGYSLLSRRTPKERPSQVSDPLEVHFKATRPAFSSSAANLSAPRPAPTLRKEPSYAAASRAVALAAEEERRRRRGEELVRQMVQSARRPVTEVPEKDEIGFLPAVEKKVRRVKHHVPSYEQPLSAVQSSPLYKEVPMGYASAQENFRWTDGEGYEEEPHSRRSRTAAQTLRGSAWQDALEDEQFNLSDRIWMLREEGMSSSAIARRMGLGIGEVELILGLQSRN